MNEPVQKDASEAVQRRASLTYRDDRMPETLQVTTFDVTEDEWQAIGEASQQKGDSGD